MSRVRLGRVAPSLFRRLCHDLECKEDIWSCNLVKKKDYFNLADTLVDFACKPRLGLRPHSHATIYGTNSLQNSTIFDLRPQACVYLSICPLHIHK